MQETRIKKYICTALYAVLLPLAKLLIRNGISYDLFARVAKQAYIDAAIKYYPIEGKKVSMSHIAIVTGIARREVAKVQKEQDWLEQSQLQYENRASRLISGWISDPQFTDGNDRAQVLHLEQGSPSFSDLVAKHGADTPVRAMYDELKRVGAIEDNDGYLTLKANVYIPSEDISEKFQIIGATLSDLLKTIDHNMTPEVPFKHPQQFIAFDNLPDEALAQIRDKSRRAINEYVKQTDIWLSSYDRDRNDMIQGSGRNRAGIGFYYFEQSHAKEDADEA